MNSENVIIDAQGKRFFNGKVKFRSWGMYFLYFKPFLQLWKLNCDKY